MDSTKLFDLIDVSYKEDLSNQPREYKACLLESAKMLWDGKSELDVCLNIYKCYHDHFMVPMTSPRENRALFQYVRDNLKDLDRKRLRDLNIGYGLIATHITFGLLN